LKPVAMHLVERTGTAPPIVCVHGYCQSSAYWVPTLDRLAAHGVQCFAVDLPGFGASSAVAGPYTVEELADALARLLDAKGISKIFLVGGSMGGVVAQHFVLRHPTRIERLLLVATGAYTADPAGALAKADAMERAAWREETVAPLVNGFFRQPPPDTEQAAYRRIALLASQQAAVEAGRSNARSHTLDRLGEIKVPTLIVQGRHDRARTPGHGAEMCDRIPNARLEVLEQSGHTPQIEEPAYFHAIALPFLLGGR
jgi:pimeloyl-ACP methyl ester carboxylesterase